MELRDAIQAAVASLIDQLKDGDYLRRLDATSALVKLAEYGMFESRTADTYC